MSVIDTRRDQVFPHLRRDQIEQARRFACASKHFGPGEVLFGLGDRNASAFIVLDGKVEVYRHDSHGQESLIVEHDKGSITGELSQLAGRASLAEGRAGPNGCDALAFDAAHLRALIIGSADIGEIVMRAFILRRTALIAEGGTGSILVGHGSEANLLRLQNFLARNGYPVLVLDVDTDEDGHEMVERLGLIESDLPVLICPNGTFFKSPSDAEAAQCLGMLPDLDPKTIYDVAVVGAGPAGLATAVYAASEGLSVLVLDSRAFGGQAGASARIENYLGFPTGISGHALTARAFTQAQKFGAEVAIPIEVENLTCDEDAEGRRFLLDLSNGLRMTARSVVIASGVRYRRLEIENLAHVEGTAVSYWASPIEAKLCAGQAVALVGGGNSAGQAVAYLSPRVKHLHLIVRADSLEASMSSYLIDRIDALPNVTKHFRTEIQKIVEGPGDTISALVLQRKDKTTEEIEVGHLFLFIGADPNTDWLKECRIDVDDKGFILTGASVPQDGRTRAPLETSLPGVFAIGDVRAASTKRVASAVGEGAQVVAAIHALLGSK
ncbi:MAG TPA: FAD-dependent oxidoreductase [Methylovirgula sp.]|jgi:thioredoxin reductase (NADPH)